VRRWIAAMCTVGALTCVCPGVTAAYGHSKRSRGRHEDPSALGYGSFASTTTSNSFSFTATTTSNGVGGSGFITVFDPREHNYYNASVTCLYVDPTTGEATIWGAVLSNNVSGAEWLSVVLNVRPGTDATAGFGNYLETYAARTRCGSVTEPPSPSITTGQITTNS